MQNRGGPRGDNLFHSSRPDKYRPFFGTSLPGYPASFSHQTGQIRIADVEIDIDGIDLVDLGQDGIFTRTHQVPRIFQPAINSSVKRSPDLRVAQIELGQVPLRFRRPQVGLGRIPLVSPVVYVGLERLPSAAPDWSNASIEFRHTPAGPSASRDCGLGLPQVVLVRVLLNEKEQLTLF